MFCGDGPAVNVALCRDYLFCVGGDFLNFEGGARVNAAVSVNGDGRPAFEVEVVKRRDPELCPAAVRSCPGRAAGKVCSNPSSMYPRARNCSSSTELGPHRLEIVRTRMVMPLLPGSIDHKEEPVRLLEHFHADGSSSRVYTARRREQSR